MKPVVVLLGLLLGVACGLLMVGAIDSDLTPKEYAHHWNEHRKLESCTLEADEPQRGLHKGDHVVCDATVGGKDDRDKPSRIPQGYRLAFYTSGCPTCATGWVLKLGTDCKEANCMN